ncbi:hypothetical protein KZZ52_17275 [Dactylosporangium sp. AC04546]|uniref:hypothetical protein n=1 Tax=Dactylosporangium sp. AC04546 TaxID=2862460 RepID=UPI001EDF1BBE|nr:hypothetical protein [Dactylosporangium sp. AC04546]WVK87050.1 hypothetical protein KZZ52_17275 [Dactylosporangium sp. AC04546]
MARIFGLMIAWAGAVFWAVGLTRLQPLTEPVGGKVASNNTYWARDLRWMAIVAIAVAFVVAARSSAAGLGRVRAWCLVAGFAAAVAADLVCDRLDVTATIPFAVGAVVVVTAGWLALNRSGPAPSARAAGPARAAVLAAAVAAAAMPLAAAIESPTDAEASLDPAAIGAGVLLAVAWLYAMLAAAPSRPRTVLAIAMAVVAVVAVVLLRQVAPGARFGPMSAVGAVMLTVTAPVGWDRRESWWRCPAVLLSALVGYPFAVVLTVLLGMMLPVPAIMTELAGSPPVNGADTDTLYALTGVLTGLAAAWIMRRSARSSFGSKHGLSAGGSGLGG